MKGIIVLAVCLGTVVGKLGEAGKEIATGNAAAGQNVAAASTAAESAGEANRVSNSPFPGDPQMPLDMDPFGSNLQRRRGYPVRRCSQCPRRMQCRYRRPGRAYCLPRFQNRRVCSQYPSPGYCNNDILRYYYDRNTGRCRRFYWTGCGGNRNRFRTYRDCRRTCVFRRRGRGLDVGARDPIGIGFDPIGRGFDPLDPIGRRDLQIRGGVGQSRNPAFDIFSGI